MAEELLETAIAHSLERIIYDNGISHIDAGPCTAFEWHFFNLLSTTTLDSLAGVGDMPMGALQTWGLTNVDKSSDNWFNSQCIIVWAANPAITRLPDFHFVTEPRYRGARLVVVAPDLSPTAIHADLCLNVRLGEGAALAVSLAQVTISERLYDERYPRAQTDLALLVRAKGRLLRQANLERNGKDNIFYFRDEKKGRVAEAPECAGSSRSTLELGEGAPALGGEFEAAGKGGTIRVRPLMALLAERLEGTATPKLVAPRGDLCRADKTACPRDRLRPLLDDLGLLGCLQILP